MRKIPFHPCMDDTANTTVARIHLPVAKKCNIRCAYCDRKSGIKDLSIQKPGVCSSVITPDEALNETIEFLKAYGRNSVVGIAGPGDPMANPETFETIKLLKEKIPDVKLCLCTNGLALYDSIDFLAEMELKHVSITINSLIPKTASKIHPFVIENGMKIEGIKASEILIENQTKSIEKAVSKGIFVKINSVVIPGINDHELQITAKKVSELGAGIMNLMPLIPSGVFSDIERPSIEMMESTYSKCEKYITVFKKCRQCRADARGIPGKEDCRWKKTA